jgi:hypothetical protein
MPNITNNPKIKDNDKANVARNGIEHRAEWMGRTYEAAKQAGADGEKILRKAISQTGEHHGASFNKKLTKPVKLNEFCDVFLSPVAVNTFEMEFKTKTSDALEIRFHYCPLISGWLKAGLPVEDVPKLCDIAMDGDRFIAKTVGIDCVIGKRISTGDECCEVNFYKKK